MVLLSELDESFRDIALLSARLFLLHPKVGDFWGTFLLLLDRGDDGAED